MGFYAQANSTFSFPQQVVGGVNRRSANYHPSVWGDYFLAYDPNLTNIDNDTQQQILVLKEQVRKMVVSSVSDHQSLKQLDMIDAIQRLGVSYHFESEIDQVLQSVYQNYNLQDDVDLRVVALQFRLLRQHGHNVSSTVFDKFKDSDGNFKRMWTRDVEGILNLYEAANLGIHGEGVLDEAIAFTRSQLESTLASLSAPLATKVENALKQPIHKRLTRVEARNFISVYQKQDSHNEALLKLAILDFNILQKMHQEELSLLSKWWKDLDFAKKLPFARDRLVECYFWALGVYFEPQFFLGRRIFTKVSALTSIIDDIYDVHATIEELVLFTDAIERWDVTAIDQLPEYMKLCYGAVMDVYNEIEEDMAKEGRSYAVDFSKATMKKLVRAYFDEAKWFYSGYVPTVEEYLEVGLVSSGYPMFSTTSFLGMRKLATKEAFDWISNNPLMVRAASVICRLTNDMVGHEFEQERGHVASAVECYMKQHGVAKQEAYAESNRQISDAWKDINTECLLPTAVPMPLLTRVHNLARFIDLVYKDEDGYTNSKTKLKDLITSILVDSVPI